MNQHQTQRLKTKKGEIAIRRKLLEQHFDKKIHFPYELDSQEIIQELKKRVSATRKVFNNLKKRSIPLSPFLEIGAEKCQRSMLLASEYGAEGIATDLSLDSLSAADKLTEPLKLDRIPPRVCADAYHLPFADNSFSFIFTFQTLHHFPTPVPIIKEIIRVLRPQGYFYLGEEPIKQKINLGLWRRPTKLRSWEKPLKMLGILPFLSRIGKTETDHAVEENEFDLGLWQTALGHFSKIEVKIKPVFFGKTASLNKDRKTNWSSPPLITRLLISLQGGGIEALCQVNKDPQSINQIGQCFACPECQNHPGLVKVSDSYHCPQCLAVYPSIQNIPVLLPPKEAALYDREK